MGLKTLRSLSIGLLIFLGISALVGSAAIIRDPSGQIVEMPPEFLQNIPFESYLLPGILLGIFNGILSLFIAWMVIRRTRGYGWYILLQGCVLLVWMSAEMLLGLYYPLLTYPYFLIGFLLALFGILQLKAHNE